MILTFSLSYPRLFYLFPGLSLSYLAYLGSLYLYLHLPSCYLVLSLIFYLYLTSQAFALLDTWFSYLYDLTGLTHSFSTCIALMTHPLRLDTVLTAQFNGFMDYSLITDHCTYASLILYQFHAWQPAWMGLGLVDRGRGFQRSILVYIVVVTVQQTLALVLSLLLYPIYSLLSPFLYITP